MRNAFVDKLLELARHDDRIFLIAADVGFSVLERFMSEFPNRFLNVGISEQNAISVAAGLSLSGKIPFVYSIIPFIVLRCFEQIKMDMAYMKTNVKIVGVGGGFAYGPAGPSHHSLEDIAIMRALPHMTVCCPGDPVETSLLIEQGMNYHSPIYYRLGKGGEPVIHDKNDSIVLGKASILHTGKDIAIITTGTMLETGKRWVNTLSRKGMEAGLVSMHTVKPLDTELIKKLIQRRIPIITLEEHNIIGGLGSAVAEVIAESGEAVTFKRMGVNDVFVSRVGSRNYLRTFLELDEFDFSLVE